MSIELDHKYIAQLANLSRLKLSDSELQSLTHQLNEVLSYVGMLEQVDTSDIQPMAHAVEQSNIFREDEPHESLTNEAALANAPKTDGKYFLVPSILHSSDR